MESSSDNANCGGPAGASSIGSWLDENPENIDTYLILMCLRLFIEVHDAEQQYVF